MTRFPARCLPTAAILLIASFPSAAAEDPGVELPPVPRAVLVAAHVEEAAGEGAQGSPSATRSEAASSSPALELGPRIVRIEPSTTVIVEGAIDHLNRIVTPFAAPKVRTVSAATTQVDSSVVYVATTSEEPVTLYITEGDDPTTAIALILAPRHIPPLREVRLVPTASGNARAVVPIIRRAAPSPSPGDARAEAYIEDIAVAWCSGVRPRWRWHSPHSWSAPPKTSGASGEERKRLITSLLTDADPRALGIEGLAERLRRVEGWLDQVASGLEKLGLTKDAEPAVDVLLARLRAENAKALAALKSEQETLRRELEQGRVPEGNAPPTPPASTPGPARPAPRTRTEKPLARLFEETGRRGAPAAGALGVRPAAAGPKSPLTIRLVTDETKPEGPTAPDDAVLILAGSILRAVFLSGMDAPTGQQARRDPYPALARIKHDAILPNRFRADVRECFLVVAGFGDMPSERAYLRTETITCVRSDGGAIEVVLDGYAVGEDGKAGVRGRLVSKQGALLANAMLAAFVDGFSKLFATVPVTAISTSPGTSAQYQQVFSAGSLQGATVSGAGKALDRLATYFLDTAEQMHPVIEIDAGRALEFVLNRGATLRLAEARRR